MTDSILLTTKKILGIEADYSAFDLDIITHINSVLTTVSQLGVGPKHGFMIEDATETWTDYLGYDRNLNAVKTYVYLRVRLLFDPPSTSFAINSMQEQVRELEWRLNVNREATQWIKPRLNAQDIYDGGDPSSAPVGVYDGGTP